MSNSNKLLNRKKKRDNGVSISRNNKEADDDNLLRFNEDDNSDSEMKKRLPSEDSTPELPQFSINKILEEDNKEESKEKPNKITKKKEYY